MNNLLKYSILLTIAAGIVTSGCQSVYYGTMEKFGYHKREILVDRVTEARDAQDEAKVQFSSALEQFASVVNFNGGELEEKYETLNDEYQTSKTRATAVTKRIADVRDVAMALFEEWEKELDEYTSDTLRRSSEDTLKQTRQQYQRLIMAMDRAESKMEPVLGAFYDQVLFLKHNLNAQAIASLRNELTDMEQEIGVLIAEMERAIQEADRFIEEMKLQ